MLALAAVVLTGCLGESGETISLGNYPGVATMRGDSMFLLVKGGEMLFPKSGMSASLMDGDCVIADFLLDRSLKENADSGKVKGFMTVDIKRVTPVAVSALRTELTDTARAISGERIISSVYDLNAFIRDRFFLFTGHRADSLPLAFDLSCNADYVDAGGVFDLFLRVFPKSGEGGASQPTAVVNVFNLDALSSRAGDSLFFRINYVRQFNADSSLIGWGMTPTFRYGIRR